MGDRLEDDPAGTAPRTGAAALGWSAAGLLALVCWALTVATYAPGYVLELGSSLLPRPGFAAACALWAIFGTVAAVALARAAGLWLESGSGGRMRRDWVALRDRRWLVYASAIAALGALAVRFGVLRGAALTDDETAYRYAAELLASGRLSTPSETPSVFFDHPFFVNDGRFFPMYFLGWPALWAPFVRLGLPALANAAWSAATVPALFLGVRERWGGSEARIATVLWLASPFLLVLAATELSHTSALCALAWAFRSYVATRRPEAGWAWHAALSASLVVAFWVRPISALGIGAPLVLLWLRDRWKAGRGARRALAAFALPAAVGAALFLAVNAELTGSVWRTGYQRAHDYQIRNEFRFSSLPGYYYARHLLFDFSEPLRALSLTAAGLFRLGFDLSGWPLGLTVLLGAVGVRRSGLAWGLGLGSLASVFFLRDPGVDSFGPVHFAELSLPWILLVSLAVQRLSPDGNGARLLAGRAPAPKRLAAAAVLALTAVAWLGWIPLRLRALGRIADNVSAPERAVERAELGPVVAFAPFPWVHPSCESLPAGHFRFVRPVSGPELESEPIVWVNHVDLERDRELMRRFEGRRGVAIRWSAECQPVLIPLESATEAILPPARQNLEW